MYSVRCKRYTFVDKAWEKEINFHGDLISRNKFLHGFVFENVNFGNFVFAEGKLIHRLNVYGCQINIFHMQCFNSEEKLYHCEYWNFNKSINVIYCYVLINSKHLQEEQFYLEIKTCLKTTSKNLSWNYFAR